MDGSRHARRSALSPLHGNALAPSPLGSSSKANPTGGAGFAKSRFHPGGGSAKERATRLPSPPLRGACENTPPAQAAGAKRPLTGSRLPRLAPRSQSASPAAASAADAFPQPGLAAPAELRAPSQSPGVAAAAPLGGGYHAFDNPSYESLEDFFASPAPGAAAAAVPSRLAAGPAPAAGDSPLVGSLAMEDSDESTGGGDAASRMPTPEAWQVLRQITQQAPGLNPQGVHGLMNAFLRTGPQQLSPEPGGTGVDADAVPAPAVAAVAGRGLMGAVGQGGAGVYGVLATYLRTGAAMLSPEPGFEAGIAAPPPDYAGVAGHGAMRAYPPGTMLTPVPPLVAALAASPAPSAAGPGAAPSSVCSNTLSSADVAASAVEPPPAPAAASPSPEVHLTLPVQPDSPFAEEAPLPTARPSPLDEQEAGQARRREPSPGAPSPVAFRLTSSSPQARPAGAEPTKPASKSFSFGLGGGAGDEVGAGVTPGPALGRTPSAETIQKPNPFGAMLAHLRQAGPATGPQYASPAVEGMRQPGAAPTSPESPKELTPLHLYSASNGPPSAGTPALGQGSVSRWIDRRGIAAALGTAARSDLRRMWAAAGEGEAALSAAEALRRENAELLQELEAVEAELDRLGVQHSAALAAADANQRSAEAEVGRAREAATQMMELAHQIQAMFALCEEEKAGLLAELEGALEDVLAAQASAAESAAEAAESEAARGEAAAQLAAAQIGAAEARARSAAAAAELAAIQAHLSAAQRQLGAAAGTELNDAPVAQLRRQLKAVHASLAALHAERDGGRAGAGDGGGIKLVWKSGAPRARLHGDIATALLEASREHLRRVGALLAVEDEPPAAPAGEEVPEEAEAVRANGELREQLAHARALLPPCSPLAAAGLASPTVEAHSPQALLLGSPVPCALSAGSPEAEAMAAPPLAGTPSAATTVTVDYRRLQAGQPGSLASPESGYCADGGGGGTPEPGCSTVVHNGMVILNVPASEVTKVQYMVQYWEAMATGEVAGEDAGEEEAESQAPGRLPAAALGLEQPTELAAAPSPAGSDHLGALLPCGWACTPGGPPGAGTPPPSAGEVPPTPEGTLALAATPGGLLRAAGLALEQESHASLAAAPSPAGSDCLGALLPSGWGCTPCATPAAGTPPPSAGEVPPTPEGAPAPAPTPGGVLRAAGLALAALVCPAPTPAPAAAPAAEAGTPATPASQRGAAVQEAATPASSFRATPGSQGLQEKMRSRLARLKADLAAAQTKLENVDLGLAAFVASPAPSSVELSFFDKEVVEAEEEEAAEEEAVCTSSPASPAGSSQDRPPTPTTGGTPANRAAASPDSPPAAMARPAAAAAPGGDENAEVNQATPLASRPSIRWAESAKGGSSTRARGALRTGTPAVLGSAARRSPVVRSVQASARPGLRGSPLAAPRGPNPLRRMYAMDSDSSDDEASSPGASRVGMRLVRDAATPGPTPQARPERPAGSPAHTGGSSSTASSFTPPQRLALVRPLRPLGRLRRPALGGGALSAAEEREFRRRAAALQIHVSPYFKPRRGGEE